MNLNNHNPKIRELEGQHHIRETQCKRVYDSLEHHSVILDLELKYKNARQHFIKTSCNPRTTPEESCRALEEYARASDAYYKTRYGHGHT